LIVFKTIRYKNILSSGNTFTEIALNQYATTLIVGSNGAGKSTILDALCFGLYNKPFRKINKAQLINTVNGKGTLVEIEFSIGKKEYLIRRGIKPNIFEIHVDGNLIDQNADAKEYQEYFETQILKLNHKSFSQIVVLGSASFVPFMQLTAANRREIVEDLLDIQIFSVMNSILKDKISTNKTSILSVDHSISSVADKIEIYKKHVESLKQNNDELIKQKQDRIASIEAKIEQHNQTIADAEAEQATLAESIADEPKVTAKINKLIDFQRVLSTKKSKIIKDNEFFDDNNDCPTCRQGIAHDHKQAIVGKNQADVTDIEQGEVLLKAELDKVRARQAEIQAVNQQMSAIRQDITSAKIEIRASQSSIADLRSEITSLNKNTTQIDVNTAAIAEHKASLKSHISSKEELLKDKQTFEIASALLKDSGIKTKIIKQYVPVINKLINKYLAAMDFFVSFELNESFEEKIKSRFRDDFSYESFSEGEKCRIDLALLFTWRTIAKLRNSASTNLLIMDEIFDSSLDTQGGDELIKIMQGIVGDSNIIVISHKTDQMIDKFDHVVRFEKVKNFSRKVE